MDYSKRGGEGGTSTQCPKSKHLWTDGVATNIYGSGLIPRDAKMYT